MYLTALLISFFAMIPFIIYGEKKRKMKRVLLGSVVTLMLTELFFWQFGDSLRALVIGTVVFFTAFNLLEASLPSLISKVSPAGGLQHTVQIPARRGNMRPIDAQRVGGQVVIASITAVKVIH